MKAFTLDSTLGEILAEMAETGVAISSTEMSFGEAKDDPDVYFVMAGGVYAAALKAVVRRIGLEAEREGGAERQQFRYSVEDSGIILPRDTMDDFSGGEE